MLGLPVGVLAAAVAWDGRVGRAEGLLLVAVYGLYVGLIWWAERRPPTIGETSELEEAVNEAEGGGHSSRAGRDLALVLVGVVAMAGGATLLVEAIRRLSGVEATQARLSLTLVGFTSGFELVVLAWSSARRGMTDAVVAGVVGSFAYNATMTLGGGALARPLAISDAGLLHRPWVLMVAALVLVLALAAWRSGRLDRPAGCVLLDAYPVVVVLVLLP